MVRGRNRHHPRLPGCRELVLPAVLLLLFSWLCLLLPIIYIFSVVFCRSRRSLIVVALVHITRKRNPPPNIEYSFLVASGKQRGALYGGETRVPASNYPSRAVSVPFKTPNRRAFFRLAHL